MWHEPSWLHRNAWTSITHLDLREGNGWRWDFKWTPNWQVVCWHTSKQVCQHLRDQMHDFFFFYSLFIYLIKLFYSFHYISFPFLKGCRLERAHCARSVFSFINIKKKKKKKKKKSILRNIQVTWYFFKVNPVNRYCRFLTLTGCTWYKMRKNEKEGDLSDVTWMF